MSGVGAKVAMNVVDNLTLEDIVASITEEKPKILQVVPGLGAKVSQRIVTELAKEPQKNIKLLASVKNVSNNAIQSYMSAGASVNVVQSNDAPRDDNECVDEVKGDKSNINIDDVSSALCNLGYDFNKSFAIARKVCEENEVLEDAIKSALQIINE